METMEVSLGSSDGHGGPDDAVPPEVMELTHEVPPEEDEVTGVGDIDFEGVGILIPGEVFSVVELTEIVEASIAFLLVNISLCEVVLVPLIYAFIETGVN